MIMMPNWKYLLLLCILYLSLCSTGAYSVNYTTLCKLHCDVGLTINCTGLNSESLGRCCVNSTHSTDNSSNVIGLDLRGCKLNSTQDLFSGMNNLLELYLEQNPITNLDVDDFTGVTQLKYLSIPVDLECPGGSEAWSSVRKENSSMLCLNEIQTCTFHNVTCPNKYSECINSGPGSTECVCKDGYYGYKCLRMGVFPTTYFVIGICVGTVVLAAVLWFTQRIHVKKKTV